MKADELLLAKARQQRELALSYFDQGDVDNGFELLVAARSTLDQVVAKRSWLGLLMLDAFL